MLENLRPVKALDATKNQILKFLKSEVSFFIYDDQDIIKEFFF